MTLSNKRITIKALGKSNNKCIAVYNRVKDLPLEEMPLEVQHIKLQSYVDNLRENVKRMIERKNKIKSD